MKDIKNVQVYPSKKRIVPNFKLCKTIYNLSDDKFADMVVDGNERKVLEKKNHKKHGDIVTIYKISTSDDADNSDPLNEFDRAVLSVCISEWEYGNRYTTPAIILRGLTGKVGRSDAEVFKNQFSAIMTSITKLMQTTIQIDDDDANEKLNYQATPSSQQTSNILPAYYVEKTINGKQSTLICFDRESPLLTIGRNRKQLLTFEASLLDVPNQNNTPLTIALKNYVMIRIQEIKLHKMLPIITFADVFKKCRIENSNPKIKMDARNTIIKFFEHLKSKGEIRDFELTKKAQSFYSIKFSYSSKVAPRKAKKLIENDTVLSA